jgi:hypothetical protein
MVFLSKRPFFTMSLDIQKPEEKFGLILLKLSTTFKYYFEKFQQEYFLVKR